MKLFELGSSRFIYAGGKLAILRHAQRTALSISLRQWKPSAWRVGDAASTPRKRISPLNKSAENQCLSRCVPKYRIKCCTFLRRIASDNGTKKFGCCRSASYFGISYSRIRWLRKVFHVNSQTKR